MEDKKRILHVLNMIVILFITMLLVSGSTFAYLVWRSGTEQQTGLAIKVTEKVNMHIENPEITDMGLYPTANCAGPGAMPIDSSGNYIAEPSLITIENQTGVIARPKFKLKVKITDRNGNVITNNASVSDSSKPYRYYINYAIAEVDGSCTEPLFAGKFDQNTATSTGGGWYNSGWVTKTNDNGFPSVSNGANNGVSFNASEYGTTTHEYRVWAWIDSSYTTTVVGNQSVTDPMQDATISISWSEDSTVEQIHADEYAVYSADDNSLRFYKSDKPITVSSKYNGRTVTNVYTGFETESYDNASEVPWHGVRSSIKTIVVEDIISPVSTARWFSEFTSCSYFELSKLNTENVINMSGMFNWSYNSTPSMSEITISGMENWDTSNVTDMDSMFMFTGTGVTTFNVSDISGWDTSKVTDMGSMFMMIADSSTNNWSLDLSNWDVYNVNYYSSSLVSNKITLPTWYTSYAVYSADDNSLRFYRTTTPIKQGDTYNERTVTNVYTGFDSETDPPWYNNSTIMKVVVEDKMSFGTLKSRFANLRSCSYLDLSKLDVSQVTNFYTAFSNTGFNASSLSIVGLENWDTSNVTNMWGMFFSTGQEATSVNIGDLSRWNTSKVTDMTSMFAMSANEASTVTLTGLENWDTSNVTTMGSMFVGFGLHDNDWSLDLSGWKVSKVTHYSGFNEVGWSDTQPIGNITEPKWVN